MEGTIVTQSELADRLRDIQSTLKRHGEDVARTEREAWDGFRLEDDVQATKFLVMRTMEAVFWALGAAIDAISASSEGGPDAG